MSANLKDFGSRVRWGAIGAVPFSALIVSLQTTQTDYAEYFLRALIVWMGFLTLTQFLEVILKPRTRAGWSRFFAFAACGAADGLWGAQTWPLSLADASPIDVGVRLTLLWMLGLAWIRAMTNIDRANPPKVPSMQMEQAEVTQKAVPQAG